MMTEDELLRYYREPGPFTTLDAFGEQVDALPDDVGELAHAVQQLLMHRFWAQRYQVDVTPERDKEQGLHSAEAMLAQAMRLDPAPIGADRPPDKRVIGICRHFATMHTAFLRRKGYAARARCGFATYFQPGKYVDHWLTEYWRADQRRWVQVESQLDEFQHATVKADFDVLDVPRARFLVAGDAWRQIKQGTIDPMQCGIAEWWGDWYVRGNLSLDVAALQNVELLPWEPFGIAKAPDSAIADTPELLELIDRVAALTAAGDHASVSELLALAERDERLRPPAATVEAARRADAAGPAAGNPIVV